MAEALTLALASAIQVFEPKFSSWSGDLGRVIPEPLCPCQPTGMWGFW